MSLKKKRGFVGKGAHNDGVRVAGVVRGDDGPRDGAMATDETLTFSVIDPSRGPPRER